MNYLELEAKMNEVSKALGNKNNLMHYNDDEIREVIIECKNEMEQVVSFYEDKLKLEKEIKKNISEANRAHAYQNFIFNSDYKLDKKIDEFAEASKITSEYAQILKELNDYLKYIDSEIEKDEVQSKLQLFPYWQELTEKFDINSIINVNNVDSYSVEENTEINHQENKSNDLKQLISSLGEDIFKEVKPKKKKFLDIFKLYT